jgi:hypothetical protein
MTTWALRAVSAAMTYVVAQAVAQRYADFLDQFTRAMGGR